MTEQLMGKAFDELASQAVEPQARDNDELRQELEQVALRFDALTQQAIAYYVEQGEPKPLLAAQVEAAAAELLAVAQTLAVAGGWPGDDEPETQRRRFQDQMVAWSADLAAAPALRQAALHVERILFRVHGARAVLERVDNDNVDVAFLSRDLLEAAGFAWLLARLIERPGGA